MAGIGQDHRLGANEAPPAIISIFLGAELRKVFETIEAGEGDPATPGSFLGLGTPVLPPLPMHGGDRNRTSPFAFTGNKFEFRALGSSQSLALPNTVLNTIVAEAIEELSAKLEKATGEGKDTNEAVVDIVRETFAANKQVCFDGDNYDEAWHAEAEKRGLANLRTTPDALPWLVEKQTIATFERYKVLSERELESRFEVMVEQYIDPREHRGRDGRLDRPHDAAAGGHPPPGRPQGGRPRRTRGRDPGARGRVLRRDPGPREGQRATTRPRRASSWPSTCATPS